MAVTLSPWPTTPAALTAALACLRQVISESDDERLGRLGAAASAHVERCAPDAPQAVKDQAVEMLAGYMAQAARTGSTMKIDTGSVSIERTTNHAAMFRNSGAAGLLSPWKVRRAGAIS